MFRRKKVSALDLTPTPTNDSAPSLPLVSPSANFSIPGVALLPSPPASPKGLHRSASSHSIAGKARTLPSGQGVGYHKPTSAFRAPSPPTFNKSPSYPSNLSMRGSSAVTPVRPNGSPNGVRTQSIASLYPSPAFLPPPPTIALGTPKIATLPSVRKSAKQPPTMNIMVVGAARTGKTSFLRTLLESVELAGRNEHEVRQKLDRFGVTKKNGGVVKRTTKMNVLSVDVLDPLRGDRTTLTVLDTPGLDVPMGPGRVGDELEVDRQISAIIRCLENRFDDTLVAEGNLFRHSHRNHDAHIHVAIYLIHPESIFVRQPRKKKISLGSYRRSLSSPQLARAGSSLSNNNAPTEEEEDSDEDEGEDAVGMSEVDLRCLKRLSRRVNVLPVLARSDELTVSQLATFKAVIKRDLAHSDLTFATFSPSPNSPTSPTSHINEEVEEEEETVDKASARGRFATPESSATARNGTDGLPPLLPSTNGNRTRQSTNNSQTDDGDDSAVDEPIKLVRIRSLSRRRGSRVGRSIEVLDAEPVTTAWDLPFALVSPDGFAKFDAEGEPKFTREFRYGILNVLDENHSDFNKLKNGVLGSQMRLLKESTRQEKYEPYRTQRLLARRSNKVVTLAEAGETREILKGLDAI